MSKILKLDEDAVHAAIADYEARWTDLPPERKDLARKVTILAAAAGGRKAAARAMGVGETTLDNYRTGATQPKFLELMALASEVGVGMDFLISGTVTAHEIARYDIDENLLERLAHVAEATYREVGQRAPAGRIAREAALLYKLLANSIDDLGDKEMVEATLPRLRLDLKRRLESGAAEPGTGKRSAL